MARIAVKLTRGSKEWRSRKISIKQEKEGSDSKARVGM